MSLVQSARRNLSVLCIDSVTSAFQKHFQMRSKSGSDSAKKCRRARYSLCERRSGSDTLRPHFGYL